ncbi:MAG: hypothetical protein M1358_18030, partial [Chloroflexi bacterium]|nr:hypothetical protein [Chloroflexota bacterium]
MLPRGFFRRPISRYSLPAIVLALVLFGLAGNYTIFQAPNSPPHSNPAAPALAGNLQTPTIPPTAEPTRIATPIVTSADTPSATPTPENQAASQVAASTEPALSPPALDSRAAFVMDADTGETLFQLNPDLW